MEQVKFFANFKEKAILEIVGKILWGAPKAAAEIAAEVVGKSAGAVLGTAKVVGQATQAVAQAAFDLGTEVARGSRYGNSC